MPHNNILKIDRDRIVNAYERVVDYYQRVAAMLGISRQTTLNIVKRFRQRGHADVFLGYGRIHLKINENMVLYMIAGFDGA